MGVVVTGEIRETHLYHAHFTRQPSLKEYDFFLPDKASEGLTLPLIPGKIWVIAVYADLVRGPRCSAFEYRLCASLVRLFTGGLFAFPAHPTEVIAECGERNSRRYQ